MTKKLFAVMIAATVVALPAVSEAKKARTDTGEYNTVVADTDPSGPSSQGQFRNGVDFTPRPGERFIRIVLEDRSGQPARGTVGQDLDGDGVQDVTHDFCGQTTAPVRFRAGTDLTVLAQDGPCEDGTPAVTTFGTITATFTR